MKPRREARAGGGGRLPPHRVPPPAAPPAPRPRARAADAATLGACAAAAVALTFPNPSKLASHLPGDGGDALLNLWILRWVEHAAPHGWGVLWDTNAFWPAPDTLAYSDALLPQAAVHGVLRLLTRSDALAFNLLWLGAWTAGLWFAYRLARRLTGSVPGAAVAALAATVATPRLAHSSHFQLAWGFLLPAVVLLTVRFFERPGPGRGAALGGGLGLLTLGSTYFGLMTAAAVAVLAAGALAWLRPRPRRPALAGLGIAVVVAAALVAPVAARYYDLQRDPYFRRDAEPQFAAHLGDFLAVAEGNHLLSGLPPFEARSRPEARSVENRLFPGAVAVAFGAFGAVVLVRRRAREPGDRWVVLLAGAGLVLLALSFGDHLAVAGRDVPMPFGPLREHLPGFGGVRAASRFVAVPQLALALLAAVGVGAVAARLGSVRARATLGAALALAVAAESATAMVFVEVPRAPAASAVNRELARRPPAPVVELPVGSPADGWRWAYVEAPRMVLSARDWQERVGGYSGYAPPGYDALAAALDRFPNRRALARLDALHVRYVVLRLALPGPLRPHQEPDVAADGVGRYTEEHALALVDAIPRHRVANFDRYGDAFLVELTPPR